MGKAAALKQYKCLIINQKQLYYYKSYPTLQNMGLYFGFSEFTVSQYLERIKPVLKTALGQSIDLKTVLFKDQAAFDQAFENPSLGDLTAPTSFQCFINA